MSSTVKYPLRVHEAVRTAYYKDDMSCLVRVLSRGDVDVNERDELGCTALHLACTYGQNKIVRCLLKREGINVDANDGGGTTPLLHAIYLHLYSYRASGMGAILEALLESGANPNAKYQNNAPFYGCTPLHYACFEGKPDLVQCLLKFGADPNLVDDTGSLPLHYVRGRLDITNLIMEGRNPQEQQRMVNLCNGVGDTPLHRCLYAYKDEQLLPRMFVTEQDLLKKVESNDSNNGNETKMEVNLECHLGKHNAELAKVLIQLGSDVLTPNKLGMKPFDIIERALVFKAADIGFTSRASPGLEAIVTFLTTIVPPMMDQSNGTTKTSNHIVTTTPLSLVASCDTVASIGGKMLLRVMAEYDQGGDLLACLVGPLISMGADISYTDPETGFNALHHLLGNRQLELELGYGYDLGLEGWINHVLDQLIPPNQQGAGLLGTITKDGRNVLHFASERGLPNVVEKLLDLAKKQQEERKACFLSRSVVQTHQPQHQHQHSNLTEAQRQQRQRNLMLHIKLIEHASRCKNAQCSSSNCAKMKNYLQHARTCKTNVRGECKICKRVWTLLRLHAEKCKKSVCPIPQCMAINEKVRQLQREQQALRKPILNVNQPDSNGTTPLHSACATGCIGTVRVLIQNGSLVTNITKKINNEGKTRTPWEEAALHENLSVKRFLKTSPLVHNQLEELCKKAVAGGLGGGGSGSGSPSLLLERLLRTGPAGVNAAYKFLPALLFSSPSSNTFPNKKKRPLSEISQP